MRTFDIYLFFTAVAFNLRFADPGVLERSNSDSREIGATISLNILSIMVNEGDFAMFARFCGLGAISLILSYCNFKNDS